MRRAAAQAPAPRHTHLLSLAAELVIVWEGREVAASPVQLCVLPLLKEAGSAPPRQERLHDGSGRAPHLHRPRERRRTSGKISWSDISPGCAGTTARAVAGTRPQRGCGSALLAPLPQPPCGRVAATAPRRRAHPGKISHLRCGGACEPGGQVQHRRAQSPTTRSAVLRVLQRLGQLASVRAPRRLDSGPSVARRMRRLLQRGQRRADHCARPMGLVLLAEALHRTLGRYFWRRGLALNTLVNGYDVVRIALLMLLMPSSRAWRGCSLLAAASMIFSQAPVWRHGANRGGRGPTTEATLVSCLYKCMAPPGTRGVPAAPAAARPRVRTTQSSLSSRSGGPSSSTCAGQGPSEGPRCHRSHDITQCRRPTAHRHRPHFARAGHRRRSPQLLLDAAGEARANGLTSATTDIVGARSAPLPRTATCAARACGAARRAPLSRLARPASRDSGKKPRLTMILPDWEPVGVAISVPEWYSNTLPGARTGCWPASCMINRRTGETADAAPGRHPCWQPGNARCFGVHAPTTALEPRGTS